MAPDREVRISGFLLRSRTGSPAFSPPLRARVFSEAQVAFGAAEEKAAGEMFKNTFQSGFLSILYSIGSKPLQIWDKKVRLRWQQLDGEQGRFLSAAWSWGWGSASGWRCPVHVGTAHGVGVPGLAASCGCEVIGTAVSHQKLDVLRDHGFPIRAVGARRVPSPSLKCRKPSGLAPATGFHSSMCRSPGLGAGCRAFVPAITGEAPPEAPGPTSTWMGFIPSISSSPPIPNITVAFATCSTFCVT